MATTQPRLENGDTPGGAFPGPISSGAGIRTPIRSSKGCCPAVERPPNAPTNPRCRGPDLNWGHRNFQSRALPTELPRQEKQKADGAWLSAENWWPTLATISDLLSAISQQPSAICSKRVTGFEPVTFSLARRRSTTEPHPRAIFGCLHLRAHYSQKHESVKIRLIRPCMVDPAGFEPAIFSVQGRRLPARPRARDTMED